MNVPSNHEITELLASALHGVGTMDIPARALRKIANDAIKEATKYHMQMERQWRKEWDNEADANAAGYNECADNVMKVCEKLRVNAKETIPVDGPNYGYVGGIVHAANYIELCVNMGFPSEKEQKRPIHE